MECPYCSSQNSKVTDKRKSPEGIRRRRECLKCKKRFTTYEKISKEELYVVKKDGKKELFDLKKIQQGIEKACEKRSISEEKINKIVSEIEEEIRRRGKKQIESSKIGEKIMKKLKKIDNVAYVRFASVYKNFQHLKDFKEEIQNLK